ncbi:SMODS domain-containing nucleotidyltransferase [Kribbella sp. NBC_00889]|uniref:SMODS domain-containing nucleotidyltransferase n=1 Tax=Kribbella sp. NBC_00889 TaxID=2975974 RepID=UPI00386830D1|nr:nucleotidyltransferase [Kribbella sp. NBC_00889]
METLSAEFEFAVSNVTIHGEKQQRAKAAHTEVRELLEADRQLRDWGIDTILIGSYARLTARFPGKDVDVFLRFKNLSVRHDPARIYEQVKRVLVAHYGLKDQDSGGRVTEQARSLKIDFEDSGVPEELAFSVDAVPAVPWREHWGIPNRNRDRWDEEDRRWVKTSPVEFADRTKTLATAASTPAVGNRSAYRPTVRLLRQVRHVHLGENRPGGLYTEIAAYYAWSDGRVTGSSWAELLAGSLGAVADEFDLAGTDGMLDPVLGTQLKPALYRDQWGSGAAKFRELAGLAKEALDADRCQAAKLWRDILGTNDRGQVLPLPDGCDANGFAIAGIAAVEAVGSNQPRGFA